MASLADFKIAFLKEARRNPTLRRLASMQVHKIEPKSIKQYEHEIKWQIYIEEAKTKAIRGERKQAYHKGSALPAIDYLELDLTDLVTAYFMAWEEAIMTKALMSRFVLYDLKTKELTTHVRTDIPGWIRRNTAKERDFFETQVTQRFRKVLPGLKRFKDSVGHGEGSPATAVGAKAAISTPENFFKYMGPVIKRVIKSTPEYKRITPKPGKSLDSYLEIIIPNVFAGAKTLRDLSRIQSKITPEAFLINVMGSEKAKELSQKELNILANLASTVYIQLLLDLKGSDSMKEVVPKIVVNAIASPLKKVASKSKTVKVTTQGPKIKRPRKVYKSTISLGKTVKGKTIKPRDIKTGRFIKQSQFQQQQKGIASSPLALIKTINSQLPPKVRANMGAPKLEHRTGRFAESTRVVNIQQTPKGYPTIEYTYMRNPYQVFEMGLGREPWATPDRDPRPLIEESIREIAKQYVQGRFFTRRV